MSLMNYLRREVEDLLEQHGFFEPFRTHMFLQPKCFRNLHLQLPVNLYPRLG
jgi:hypothetical protein